MLEANLILVLILKPLVLIADDFILIPFWKLRKETGILVIFWSSIIFMIGELTCAIDVYILNRMTLVNESIHDLSMLIAFSGYFWGGFQRWMHTHGCFKNDCPKYQSCETDPMSCKLHEKTGVFPGYLLIGGIILSILPMFATPLVYQTVLSAGYGTTIIGSFLYDRTQELYFLQQIIFPTLAIISFGFVSIRVFISRRMRSTDWKIVCFALGTLSFVYFRMLLIHVFHPNVVFTVVGEEILEVMFMVILALWIFPYYKKHNASREQG